jgi:CMP-N-acetylneuraminic acid synthetase
MNIVAMVPVRKGSKRVPSKNSKLFADTTLLDIRLNVLKQVKGLSDIIVSTDCDKCVEIATSHGVTIINRDPYYAGDISNEIFLKNLASSCPSEHMLYSTVTSPLLKVSTLESAIDTFIKNCPSIDSMISVNHEKKHMWKDGKSFNYDSTQSTPRSQDLPNIVSLNFAVSLIKTDVLLRTGSLVGDNPLFFEISKIESTDIDEEEDFMIAELLFKRLGMDWVTQ